MRGCRGSGYSETVFGRVDWKPWDLFLLPGTEQEITHHAHGNSAEEGGAALFWWHDEPLLKYLGAGPITPTGHLPPHILQQGGTLSQLILRPFCKDSQVILYALRCESLGT